MIVVLWLGGVSLMLWMLLWMAWRRWLDYLCRKHGHRWKATNDGHVCRRCDKPLRIS